MFSGVEISSVGVLFCAAEVLKSMNEAEVPAIVSEWVKSHPIVAATAAVVLLGVVVVIAVRHGDITNWP